MTPDEAMAHDWFVEAQKRCRTRVCNRRIDTPTPSVTKVQRSPVKGQNNTSTSKTQHSPGKSTTMTSSHQNDVERSPHQAFVKSPKPGVIGSPKQAAERSPKQGVTAFPKQATQKSPKQGVTGVIRSPKQACERLLKPGVAVSPNLSVKESLMHIPRPPNKPADRPAKPWLIRTHRLVVNKVSASPSQATETSSWQGVAKKSPKQVAAMASPKYGTANPPRQWIPRPPPNQEAATTATESNDPGGRKGEVVRRRPGRRIIIPPSDARNPSSDQDVSKFWRRLN